MTDHGRSSSPKKYPKDGIFRFINWVGILPIYDIVLGRKIKGDQENMTFL